MSKLRLWLMQRTFRKIPCEQDSSEQSSEVKPLSSEGLEDTKLSLKS